VQFLGDRAQTHGSPLTSLLTRGDDVRMAGVPVRVLVADDQDLAAAGTAAALDSGSEFELVGVAATAAEATALAASSRPDVALVDVELPGGSVTAAQGILRASPATRLLAHAGVSDHEAVIGMLRAGASGYLVRGAPAARLVSALRAVADGDAVFDDIVHVTQRAHDERALKRARIRAAMEHDELDIHFQPIVALDSRAVVGHEALARFAGHPRRGPDLWFKEAHEVGLGVELELWAIRVACARSHALPDGTFMAVNVSPATAERPDLLDVLDEAHVDHVVLEVTEHARVEDYPRFRVAIARVRELGARLAVDDAGAGFASLRHILELDAELIKLDGSLTRSLETDPRRRMLASALIEFGRESGAAVLAEHVESELQLIELRRLGVQYGQGFHLGRPRPVPLAVEAVG
jgi:EAL domain-containing protein (putative c-di-GMP-specific phosphodiesterase class I)/AmiR/NasT family two-component response regulator